MLWQSRTVVFVWRRYMGTITTVDYLPSKEQCLIFCPYTDDSLTVVLVSIEFIDGKNTFHRRAWPQHCGVGIPTRSLGTFSSYFVLALLETYSFSLSGLSH